MALKPACSGSRSGATRSACLQKRLDQRELDIEARLSEHDEQLRQIFEALRQLIAPPFGAKHLIGEGPPFRLFRDDGVLCSVAKALDRS